MTLDLNNCIFQDLVYVVDLGGGGGGDKLVR